MNFPHTATVNRLVETNGKYLFAAVGTTKCFLQPIDTESSEMYAITFSKGSVAYLPITADVKESDQLLIDGIKYGVRGKRLHNYGSLKHAKAALEQL